ncbi:WDR55 [Scenedesmus sp. PABB004]|nr:WDR55 [Scenedesmus sp. PABB004]
MASAAACSIELPEQPMDCAISPAAPLLASGLVNGGVVLHRYEPADGAAPAPDSDDEDNTGGHEAATGGAGGGGAQQQPRPAYVAREVLSRPSKKGASCRALAWAAGGGGLAAGFATGTLLSLDPASGRPAARLTRAHGAGVTRLLGLPEQPALLAAGDDDGALCVWDLRAPAAPARRYDAHSDFVSGLACAPRAHALLAVSGDGTLSAHDLRGGKTLGHSETDADDELLSVAVVKGGKKVVCGGQSGVLALWSWGYWADCSDRFPGHPESVDALAAFDDDTLITGSSDGALRIVSVLPNRLVGVLGTHPGGLPVERLALSDDRAVLASTGHDAVVKLWDLAVLRDDDGEEEEEEEQGEQEPAAAEEQQQQQAPAAAGAAAAAGAKRRKQGGGGGGSSSGDDDSDSDGDAPRGGRKKRQPREKTAMRRGKAGGGANFFADML